MTTTGSDRADGRSNGSEGAPASAVPTGRPPTGLTPAAKAKGVARLAAACHDHRKRVLIGWVIALIVVSAAGGIVKGKFQDNFGGGNAESQQARRLLQQRFPAQAGDSAQAVFHTDSPVTSPANMAAINAAIAQIKTFPHVIAVQSPFEPQNAGQIARSGLTAFANVQFDKASDDLTKNDVLPVLERTKALEKPGLQIELGGGPIAKAETPSLGSSEGIGILAAIIILLFAFGSVIAMGLPIITALFGIAVAIGFINLISNGLTVPTFGTELAAMVGLGVGIDYALFIVTRYRQGLKDGLEPRAAVINALNTSGRAVVFAGCTVIISLLGMLLLGLPFVYGLAFGAITAVLLVMLASMTLLPALLSFSGRAIDKLSVTRKKAEKHHRQSFWWSWSRIIQRRAWLAALVSLAILVVLAIPMFSMHLSFTDAGNNQPSQSTRKAYDLLSTEFGPGANGPLVLAVESPGNTGRATVEKLTTTLQSTPGVTFASPPTFNQSGDTAVIILIPTTSPQDNATEQLVHRIRKEVVPSVTAGTGVKALVGGITAAAVDSSAQLSSRLIYVIGGVVILSFILLMSVFRSVAVPLKAAIMNLLSIGAAYGVIVAVFQWGWLGGVIGIGRTGPIDPWVPLMLFTILFGLSMDYEVFLLSRIREEYLETHDNAVSVADGLAATARVITAAAAIMVCVFGSFVLGDIRVLKLFGLGLASAVLVDATLVRMVLVPATMELLGDKNWWFPKWLDSIVPRLSVESGPTPEAVPATAGEVTPG